MLEVREIKVNQAKGVITDEFPSSEIMGTLAHIEIFEATFAKPRVEPSRMHTKVVRMSLRARLWWSEGSE